MPAKQMVLVTLDYPPETGGVARYLGDLVEASQNKMRVIVPETHATRGPGQIETREMLWRYWPHWWPMVRIIRQLDRTREVVLVSHVFPVGVAAFISWLMGGPAYTVLFHGLDLKLISSFWKRCLLSLVCFGAKSLMVNSLATKKILREKLLLGKRKNAIIATPGVKPRPYMDKREAREKLGLEYSRPVVLSISRLVPRKGIDVTLEAIGMLQKKQELTYVVSGDGMDYPRLLACAETADAQVEWKKLDDEEKWTWLAACDVFCLPVRETENDMEGFGIVYLEAAAAGRPTIAGKSGGAAEAVVHGETGFVVEPNAEAIAEAIQDLLAHPEKAEQMGKQGRERALRDFSWQERWHSVETLLER